MTEHFMKNLRLHNLHFNRKFHQNRFLNECGRMYLAKIQGSHSHEVPESLCFVRCK